MRVISANALMMKEIAPNVYLVDEEVIRNAPTFDAEPVRHGWWVYDHWCEFKCSCCGHFSSTNPRGIEKYCPNCGVKMDEASE